MRQHPDGTIVWEHGDERYAYTVKGISDDLNGREVYLLNRLNDHPNLEGPVVKTFDAKSETWTA